MVLPVHGGADRMGPRQTEGPRARPVEHRDPSLFARGTSPRSTKFRGGFRRHSAGQEPSATDMTRSGTWLPVVG